MKPRQQKTHAINQRRRIGGFLSSCDLIRLFCGATTLVQTPTERARREDGELRLPLRYVKEYRSAMAEVQAQSRQRQRRKRGLRVLLRSRQCDAVVTSREWEWGERIHNNKLNIGSKIQGVQSGRHKSSRFATGSKLRHRRLEADIRFYFEQ